MMTRQSMTGFARLDGQAEQGQWQWEVRSVNGRGLDLRLRLPEGLEALEKDIRALAPKYVARGNVNLTLRYTQTMGAMAVAVNAAALDAALQALSQIEAAAMAQSFDLKPTSAAEVMSMRSVIETVSDRSIPEPVLAEIKAQVAPLFDAFRAARESEGLAIENILRGQIAQLAVLGKQAAVSAEARLAKSGEVLRQKVAALLKTTDLADEDRLQQELALLAVKADVTEELDRLSAHIDAASALLGEAGAVGRKFDFLMQEFNRETNTLCSKSGSIELTSIGLEMKTVIDQMREQVQNLE